MKVNNNIEQIGKITITVQVQKKNEIKHIAYRYGEIDGVTKVYQAWLISMDKDYPIETDPSKILLEIENIRFQLKKRWRNQGKNVAMRIYLENNLDTSLDDYISKNGG